MYNFHPGSHVGQGFEIGKKYIVKALNEILTKNQTTTVFIRNNGRKRERNR